MYPLLKRAIDMKEEGYQIQQIPRSSPKSIVRSSTDNLWFQTCSYPLANTLTPLSSTQIWYPLHSDNGTGELQVTTLRAGSPERAYRRCERGTVITPCDEYGTVFAPYYTTTVCCRIYSVVCAKTDLRQSPSSLRAGLVYTEEWLVSLAKSP